MSTRTRTIVVATALVATFALAGCGGEPTPVNPRTDTTMTTQSDTIRHDPEPLTKRFPAIERPVSVTWVGWSNASGRAPGPTTYWVQAIIELEPAVAAGLRTRFAPADTGRSPDMTAALRDVLPPARFLSSSALGDALSSAEWRSAAFIAAQSDTLVIDSISAP